MSHNDLLSKGWIALPIGWEPPVQKAASHKYVKRVPYTDNKGRKRYRYYYHAVAGRGVGLDFHMKAGSAFKYGKGHYHIEKVDGDKVTIKHDESGRTATMTKKQLSDKLHAKHKPAIDAHKRKIAEKLRTTSGPARSHWIGQARRWGVDVPKKPSKRPSLSVVPGEGKSSDKKRLETLLEIYKKNLKRQGGSNKFLEQKIADLERELSAAEKEQRRRAAEASARKRKKAPEDKPVKPADLTRDREAARLTEMEKEYKEKVKALSNKQLENDSLYSSEPSLAKIAHEELKRREAKESKKPAGDHTPAPLSDPATEPDNTVIYGLNEDGTKAVYFTKKDGKWFDADDLKVSTLRVQTAILRQRNAGEKFQLYREVATKKEVDAVAEEAKKRDELAREGAEALKEDRKKKQAKEINAAIARHEAAGKEHTESQKNPTSGAAVAAHVGARSAHRKAAAAYAMAATGKGTMEAANKAAKEAEEATKRAKDVERKASAPRVAPLQDRFMDEPVATVNEHIRAARAGTTTAEEHKRAALMLLDNQEAVKESLAKRYKKAELDRMSSGFFRERHRNKAEAVNAVFRRLINSYDIGEGSGSFVISYGFGKDAIEKQLRERIEKITDDDIKKHSERLKEQAKEREKKKAEREQALTNPKTLADYRLMQEVKGRSAMNEAQQREFDRLDAESRKAARQLRKEKEATDRATVQRIEGAGGMEVVEGIHTKKGHKIWTAKLGDRVDRDKFTELRSAAKKLGGYYSRFTGGFIFDNAENASKFAGIGESGATGDVSVRERKSNHENLAELAEKHHAKHTNELNRDRQTNTARRAAHASYAAANAMQSMRLADSARKIAQAQKDGNAKHLAGIRHMTHVEALEDAARIATHRQVQAEANEKDPVNSYNYYEANKDRDLTHADIERVKYPYPNEHVEHLERMVEGIRGMRGARGTIAEVQSLINDAKKNKNHLATFETPRQIEALKDLMSRAKRRDVHSGWSGEESIKEYNRMQSMDIHSPSELREALREYSEVRGSKVTRSKESKMRDRELELARAKIPGYFPTPKPIVSKMISEAGISDGDTVLEPSAGAGHIADSAKASGAVVHTLESNNSLREHLEGKGHHVVGTDALDHHQKYDKVIMNPPFERSQDIQHVMHAFDHNLEDGGRLVAIVSEGPFYRQDSKAKEFRAWLEKHGGTSEKLPEGSFKQSDRKTGVNTRMIVVDKPVKKATFSDFAKAVMREAGYTRVYF